MDAFDKLIKELLGFQKNLSPAKNHVPSPQALIDYLEHEPDRIGISV